MVLRYGERSTIVGLGGQAIASLLSDSNRTETTEKKLSTEMSRLISLAKLELDSLAKRGNYGKIYPIQHTTPL